MKRFSKTFALDKTQSELDFVDVPVDGDIPLFVDPFAIGLRPEEFAQNCHQTLVAFFQRVIDAIRGGRDEYAFQLLQHLGEPNETRFGFSRNKPQGAGVGAHQSRQLLEALKKSSAIKTGFISSLEECELMVEGVGRDKISDLTTNIIRYHLAQYTDAQCKLLDIPTHSVPLGPYYSLDQEQWVNDYYSLPVADNKPVLLVPKVFARFDPSYEHDKYYRHFVLNYLRAEALDAGSSLVRTLKNGKRVVYKKDLEPTFPKTKENLFKFSQEHPKVLKEYKEHLAGVFKRSRASDVDEEDQDKIAELLRVALESIEPGTEQASDFHNLMIGILEFLFFPSLLGPRKEQEIHEGRKRIDIVMENGAQSGIFHRLYSVRNLPCPFVMIECKNYGKDVGNPELDQLAGRFSPNRGKFGLLICRSVANRKKLIQRCRDAFKDDRGLMICLDDEIISEFLKLISSKHRHLIDERVAELIDEIWLD